MATGVPFGKYSSLSAALAAEPDNPELKSVKGARRLYAMIKQRCENPNCPRYKDYGGRGIALKISLDDFVAWYCKETALWDKSGPRKTWPSVDRVKNSGHYEKGNVRIIPLSENARKMYQDSDIRRPHLSKSNVVLKGVRVKVEGKVFPSILAASRYFGRSVVWVHPRMERV